MIEMKFFLEKYKKVVLLIVSILTVLTVLLNTTYSLLFKTDDTKTQVAETGVLEIQSDTNGSVTLTNSFPVSDSVGATLTPYTFKINNKANVAFNFDVKMMSTTATNQIDAKYIKIKVNDEPITTLSSLIDSVILSNMTVGGGSSSEIILRVWLDENTPNSEIGKTFTAKLVTDAQSMSYGKKDYIADLSGNDRNGVLHGATFTTEGLSFDGTDDYILLPTDLEVTFPATYSVRFKTSLTGNQILFGDINTGASIGLYSSNTKFIVAIGNYAAVFPTNSLALNTFYTVDVVYNSLTDISLYINGTKMTATSETNYWTWDDKNNYIGRRYDSSSGSGGKNYFKGVIERFMVYDSALTASQISTNYAVTNAVVDTDGSGIIDTDLSLYYNFKKSNESYVAYDLSGNDNDGSIFGATFINGELEFDGSDDYISLPRDTKVTLPATYSITFKTNKTNSQLLFGDYHTRAGLGLYNTNNTFLLNLPSTTTYTYPTGGITLDTYYTVDVVYNSITSVDLYLNGVKLTANTEKNYWNWSGTNSYIGRNVTGNSNLKGRIKRFMIYDSALTAEQIAANYAVDNTTIGEGGILADDLKLYYNFEAR